VSFSTTPALVSSPPRSFNLLFPSSTRDHPLPYSIRHPSLCPRFLSVLDPSLLPPNFPVVNVLLRARKVTRSFPESDALPSPTISLQLTMVVFVIPDFFPLRNVFPFAFLSRLNFSLFHYSLPSLIHFRVCILVLSFSQSLMHSLYLFAGT